MDIIQKTRDDYNKIAKYFSDTRYQAKELEQFKPFIKDGQHILDWGCGNGRLIQILNDKPVDYYGLDQSQGLLKMAKKIHAGDIKKGWVHFYCTAHKDKVFANNFFDVAFLIASFHHLPDVRTRQKLLKKLFKEIKPGGHIVITVWNLGSDWAKEKIKKGWKVWGDNDFYVPWKNPAGEIMAERYYHHFKEDELRDLVEGSGFTIEKLSYSSQEKWTDKKGGRNLVVIAKK